MLAQGYSFFTGAQARVTNEEFKRGVVKTAMERADARDFYREDNLLVQITKLISTGEEFANAQLQMALCLPSIDRSSTSLLPVHDLLFA
jgi:hypothetical protein